MSSMTPRAWPLRAASLGTVLTLPVCQCVCWETSCFQPSVSSPHLLSLSPSLSLVAHQYSGLQVKGVATHLQFSALIANNFEKAKEKGKEKTVVNEAAGWPWAFPLV